MEHNRHRRLRIASLLPSLLLAGLLATAAGTPQAAADGVVQLMLTPSR